MLGLVTCGRGSSLEAEELLRRRGPDFRLWTKRVEGVERCELPIDEHRTEFIAMLDKFPVVVVQGDQF